MFQETVIFLLNLLTQKYAIRDGSSTETGDRSPFN